MRPRGREYVPIMTLTAAPGVTTFTVVVTVTGITMMPVLPDAELRML